MKSEFYIHRWRNLRKNIFKQFSELKSIRITVGNTAPYWSTATPHLLVNCNTALLLVNCNTTPIGQLVQRSFMFSAYRRWYKQINPLNLNAQ